MAYKNQIGTRRAAWRTISAIQNKEEYKGSKHLDLIKMYRKKIEKEMEDICHEVLDLLEHDLIAKVDKVPEAKVFYMKMQGDYNRYLCEFTSSAEQ